MLKILIIAVAIGLLLWLLFGRGARNGKPPRGAPPDARGGPEEMVSCAHCGVNLPRSEALAARSLHYCSAAHRDAPLRD
jgi:uncharacterized protein